MKTRRSAVTAAISTAVGVSVAVSLVIISLLVAPPTEETATPRNHGIRTARPTSGASDRPAHDSAVYAEPTAVALAGLPDVRYDAVISGLIPHMAGLVTPAVDTVYSLESDTAIYGVGRTVPVARFSATNFLGDPTVVVPVEISGDWARVLTPARQALPSASNGDAPAQTSGWIRARALTKPVPLTRRIVVSVSAQTMAIVSNGGTEQTFGVAVGASKTPTPHGVTGYLQARYLDPLQGQSRYPVQLTSLHSSAADEPFGGSDGGLIGLHYERTTSGAVSHGCVRLTAAAIAVVNALPLGTTLTMVE